MKRHVRVDRFRSHGLWRLAQSLALLSLLHVLSIRNVRVWHNRVRNVLMGISFQPVWIGPMYALRNVIYNTAAAPFKLNNSPTGIVLYHNTAFRFREIDIGGPYDGNA